MNKLNIQYSCVVNNEIFCLPYEINGRIAIKSKHPQLSQKLPENALQHAQRCQIKQEIPFGLPKGST